MYLNTDRFPKGPVISGGLECVDRPLLQQTPGHHVTLYILQNVPQYLVTRLWPPGLDRRQALVVPSNRGVMLDSPLGTSLWNKKETEKMDIRSKTYM